MTSMPSSRPRRPYRGKLRSQPRPSGRLVWPAQGWSPTSNSSRISRRVTTSRYLASIAGRVATGSCCLGSLVAKSCDRRVRIGRTDIPPLGRWNLVHNLRRTFLAPASFLALVTGWVLLPPNRRLALERVRSVAFPVECIPASRRARDFWVVPELLRQPLPRISFGISDSP